MKTRRLFRPLILVCMAAMGLASLAALASLAVPQPVAAQDTTPPIVVMDINGELAQPMIEYLGRGLQVAEQNGAGMILLNLDTPGGQITLMSDLVEMLRSSPVPLVVYVNPLGAMAASAGTLITLAGDLSAMAPQTTIGSASPVGSGGANIDSVEERKIKETMRALARSLTQHRPERATELAEDTIETAKAVSAEEALQIGLVDYIATDRQDLLNQLDGRTIQTPAGTFTLQTAGARQIPVSHTFIETLLLTLTNPNIVFLLLTIGVQAILIELSSPGGWVAGFIGVVSLALAVYGLGILPVNYFGLAFLVISFVLFLLDIKAPTHGALTAAGLASFITGALVLFNSPGVPSFQRVSVPLVVLMGLITAGVFAVIVSFGILAQRRPAKMEVKSLVGRQGIVRTALNPRGTVQLASELWSAELDPGEESLASGSRVEVTRVEGFHLHVKRA